MPREDQARIEVPRIAPDVVVEVRSPGDLTQDIEEKVRVYLAAGTEVVFLVDPETRSVTVRDHTGSRTVGEDDVLEHEALAGFSLPARTLFELPGG